MKKILLFLLVTFISINVRAYTVQERIDNLESDLGTLNGEINNLNSTDEKYPVGSIYISVSSDNPSTKFGGSWEAYGSGRKLVGVGSNGTTNYSYNSTSGSSGKTIALANMPAHTHTLTATGSVSSTFTGTAATSSSSGGHNHTAPWKTSSQEASGYGLSDATGHRAYENRILVNQGTTLTTDLYIYSSESGDHSHALTASGSVTSTFTGSSATTSEIGSGSSFSILNPYVTVYMWKRVS